MMYYMSNKIIKGSLKDTQVFLKNKLYIYKSILYIIKYIKKYKEIRYR